ncbi:hypothetical protein [Streptomyces sp. IB2014 011-1]|uniref:hypothetical protein n=1 Tax=Streptomyces sp. IB2014 011-1 TaxID=1844478 RepID=UPI000978FA28|nr:hypothetical protein [Streptomyces sp. IB2014 011-1]ONI55092.1 hypothetical protein STIB_06620 [Streptomyces sp. IB2014 011-1]
MDRDAAGRDVVDRDVVDRDVVDRDVVDRDVVDRDVVDRDVVDRDVVDRDVVDRVVAGCDVKAFDYLLLITGEITQPNPDGRRLPLDARERAYAREGAVTHMGELCQPGWILALLAGICSR